MIPKRWKRYNFFNILKNNPEKIVTEGHRISNEIFFWFNYGRGINIMDEDWDNLILIDACRYDVFANINSINGSLESRISSGSSSREFIEKNFVNKTLHIPFI